MPGKHSDHNFIYFWKKMKKKKNARKNYQKNFSKNFTPPPPEFLGVFLRKNRQVLRIP
jgi:hypothetical protein